MGEENTKVKAEVLISHAEYSRMNGLCPDVNEGKVQAGSNRSSAISWDSGLSGKLSCYLYCPANVLFANDLSTQRNTV
jgi:hypothetical protein